MNEHTDRADAGRKRADDFLKEMAGAGLVPEDLGGPNEFAHAAAVSHVARVCRVPVPVAQQAVDDFRTPKQTVTVRMVRIAQADDPDGRTINEVLDLAQVNGDILDWAFVGPSETLRVPLGYREGDFIHARPV